MLPDTQILADQLFKEGTACRINGEYDSAIDMFKRVIIECPDRADVHMELGLAYCFTGLFDESIEELSLAAKLQPTNVEILMHLAKTYTMLGMYEEGIPIFRLILTLTTPDDKNYDEACKQLSYLAAFAPGS